MVIAMLLLSHPDNLRLLSMITEVGMCVMDWHAHENREGRDVYRAKQWLLSEVSGGFQKHLWRITRVLSDRDILQSAGFVRVSLQATLGMTEAEILHDNEHAEMFGDLVLTLLALRYRRCAWMFLPPVSMVAMLAPDPAVASAAVESLRQTQEDFEALQGLESPSARIRQFIARHPCNLVSVVQLVEGFKAGGWSRENGAVLDLLHQRFACLVGTQIVEDCNNVQKNARVSTGWGGRYRRPETSMHAAVTSKLLDEMHRYHAVRPLSGGETRARLDRGDFYLEGQPSVPADSVVGTKAEAPYFSPAAENVALPLADTVVIREALRSGDTEIFGQCWQGFWCSSSHNLCFQVVDGEEVLVDWRVALCHFRDSACVAAPVRLQNPLMSENECYIEFLPEMPRLLCLADVHKVRAFRFGWRSWSWQAQRFPNATGSWCPAVRAFRVGTVEPVLATAARAGWWSP